jgi:hypothetical protein
MQSEVYTAFFFIQLERFNQVLVSILHYMIQAYTLFHYDRL